MVLRSSIQKAGWILAAWAALSGCSRPSAGDVREAVPELRLEGVRFRLFRGAVLRADGTAAAVTYQRDSTAVGANDLALRLHEGRELVVLTAPAGEGVASSRTFQVSGGLRAVRGTDTAVTDSARFDPTVGNQGQVIGDRPVELSGRGYRLRGNGFTLDPAVGQIALRGGTRLVAGLQGAK
jgi:lipopolysaccharide export system protein LptC